MCRVHRVAALVIVFDAPLALLSVNETLKSLDAQGNVPIRRLYACSSRGPRHRRKRDVGGFLTGPICTTASKSFAGAISMSLLAFVGI